jgi:hypothetical protein
MNVEQSTEWELAEETEVLEENLPQCHVVHHKSNMTWPGIEPGAPRWEANGYGSVVAEAVYFGECVLRSRKNPLLVSSYYKKIEAGTAFKTFVPVYQTTRLNVS